MIISTVVGLEAALGARLEARVCPGQIAVAGLLAMPVTELARAVEKEISSNPALEVGQPPVGGWTAWDAGEIERVAAPVSAAQAILAEVAIAAGDRSIAERILGDLDPRGRLGRTPAEAACWLGVDVARVERVLRRLREATRPDLAAADLRDALLLQADELADAPELLRPLVWDHLEDVAAGRWEAIAAALGADRSRVMSTVDYLRERLSPGYYEPAGVAPVALSPPDIVLATGTEIEVFLTAAHPALAVDPAYRRMAADPAGLDQETAERVRAQVASAEGFIEQLARRHDTLARIAEAVTRRQTGFVTHGPRAHRPLTRNDIAEEVGAHPSTVSRAVSGKVVRLPDGTHLPLAEFFGGAVSVCDVLAELVSDESAPMSDAALARELAARGLRVARRTVAKYRARLMIPAVGVR